jgi:putative nucleotidyltransferase with HDIG domain
VRPRQRLVSYIIAISVGGGAAAAWAASVVPTSRALLVMGAVVLAEGFASRLRDDVKVSLTNVVILVAILIGSAGHAEQPAMAAALGILAASGTLFVVPFQVKQQRLLRTAFNVGQLCLSAAAGGFVFVAIAARLGAVFPDLLSLVAISVAALVFTVLNHLLVAFVVAIAQGEPLRSSLRSIGPSAVLQVPYVGIAVLAAVILLRASPWALLLMAVPTLIARYGLLAFQRLDESYDRLVRGFVKAIELKDLYTRGHSERVAELSVLVAEELGVPYDERRLTRYAALLHDVGKIGVPLCIINKPGALDDDEFEAIKQHPSIGADILYDIDFLAPAIDIVRYHHERLDGRGYPHGVGEEELSDIVRIVTAVDAFDAMTSTRSYRRALTVADAVAELRRCAGAQFDPRMVEALARVVDRIGWQPTIEFASEAHLHGDEIPMGTAQERLGQDVSERAG